MTSKTYPGQYHILINENGNDIYFGPKYKQNLHISGVSFGSLQIINVLSDFPEPVSGVITLQENSYLITSDIDLLGSRIVCDSTINISGTFSEISKLRSTGLVGNLITSTHSLGLFDISLYGTVLDLSTATPLQAVYFRSCNIYGTFGTVDGYTLVMLTDCYWYGSELTITGAISTFGAQNCIFQNVDENTTIDFDALAVIDTRIKFMDSSFITDGAGISVNVNASATVPNEGYLINNCVFSGTSTTYLSGVDYTSNKSIFTNNKGISNSRSVVSMNVATPVGTTLTLQVWKKLAMMSNLVSGIKFTMPLNNIITYTGSVTQIFTVNYNVGLTGTVNDFVWVGISKNAATPADETITRGSIDAVGRIGFLSCMFFVELSTNDTLSLQVYNDTGSNLVTCDNCNLTVIGQ